MTMTVRRAQVGSISSGTLRLSDLIPTLADELAYLSAASAMPGSETACLIERAKGCDPDGEGSEYYLQELIDALDDRAPPYCYFGTHEGDGADFGFWPLAEAIEDLPRVASGDEARALGEDCVYVNDHGNVTVFGGDGSVLLELV